MTTPATDDNLRPAGAFLRLALLGALTASGVAALGYWPTVRVAGTGSVSAMLAGIVVALLGGWAGMLPVLAKLRGPANELTNAILMSVGLRFAVTIALAMALAFADFFAVRPFILWVAIAQLFILFVDTLGLVRLVKQASRTA